MDAATAGASATHGPTRHQSALSVDTVRDLLHTHNAAAFPSELPGGSEVAGVALVLLDADISGLAAAYLGADGALTGDQWQTLRESADVVRTVVPGLAGEAWVYFGRLHALAQAMLRGAVDRPGV